MYFLLSLPYFLRLPFFQTRHVSLNSYANIDVLNSRRIPRDNGGKGAYDFPEK
jgi:hypothetical protein